MDGTKKLVESYRKQFGDYCFITCSCGKQIDYVGHDLIRCINCRNFYCTSCQFDLVLDITHSTICDCTNSTQYYQCGFHYYCNACQLVDCDLCESDVRDNCPQCNERIPWKGKTLCSTHYEMCDFFGYNTDCGSEDEHDFAPKTPEAWYQHNLSCIGNHINREEYSKQRCECKF